MNYSDTVERVMSLLKEKKVCSSSRKSHRDCYESLGSYLDQNGTEYTVKLRDEWFAELKKVNLHKDVSYSSDMYIN